MKLKEKLTSKVTLTNKRYAVRTWSDMQDMKKRMRTVFYGLFINFCYWKIVMKETGERGMNRKMWLIDVAVGEFLIIFSADFVR